MRILRVLAGAALMLLGIVLLWASGIVEPPETVARRIAAVYALYPGSSEGAVVDLIPCRPLRRLRLYVVCTGDCEEVWRVVAVRGLSARHLMDLNRRPPEPAEEMQRRLNEAITGEGMRLDEEGARQMCACHLRIAGLYPELVLTGDLRDAVERVRGDEEAMAALAATLDEPGAAARIPVEEVREGYEARFFYWATSEVGRPVLDLRLRLGTDGRLLSLDGREAAGPSGSGLTGDTASGSTPATPPI